MSRRPRCRAGCGGPAHTGFPLTDCPGDREGAPPLSPAARLLTALRLALGQQSPQDQQRLIWQWMEIADPVDAPGKTLLLLCLLLRRDEAGQPDPISLQELGELLRVTPSQRARYLRDWSAADWPLCRRGLGSQGGGGRAPADQVAVWSLYPGEAIIV